ncbi:MAG: hypothetical protein DHS20C17_03720 [Cyclobacteriaceae bacterium]|nr:MAG: hypothetical protein DHS20C17_03720 [Cyclobacteriaceae bacterium]
MRPQKISDQELTVNMLEILRSRGYDGSSLNDLALVGGLKKASLYHRYPGGKETLVQSVLDHFTGEFEHRVFSVLTAKKKKPKKKLTAALRSIALIYDNGGANCLYRALSMQSGMEIFGAQIRENCQKWLKSFEHIGKDFGFKKKKSKLLALESLIKIQGSLVLSNIFGDRKLFIETLNDIKNSYLGN